MEKTDNSVCCGCTCLCDDIELSVSGGKIVGARNACQLGEEWYSKTKFVTFENEFFCNGKPVTLEAALNTASKLIKQCKSPLVTGLDGFSTQSQIEAVKLAKRVGAVVSSTLTGINCDAMAALQSVGKVTASLGEVATRGDTVIFWFCDPVKTHPRFIERFCKSASQIIVVDENETATANAADEFVQIPCQDLFSFLSNLRHQNREQTYQVPKRARQFWNQITNANYGAHIYGDLEYSQIKSLYLLVRELNTHNRSVAIELRQGRNAKSAENVLAWNCGFPNSVSFRTGNAEYNGPEHSSERVLANKECDFALLGYPHSDDALSLKASEHLSSIPTVVFSKQSMNLKFKPSVEFRVGFDFGNWSRMDDVLIPVANLSPDRTVVSKILKQIAR